PDASSAPAEQLFDIRQLELHIGRPAMVALAGMGRGFHLAQQGVHLLAIQAASGPHAGVAGQGAGHLFQPLLQGQRIAGLRAPTPVPRVLLSLDGASPPLTPPPPTARPSTPRPAVAPARLDPPPPPTPPAAATCKPTRARPAPRHPPTNYHRPASDPVPASPL